MSEKTVLISTGESSGELYGSLLAEALMKKIAVRIIGIGGERMKAAGVELISGFSSAFGITEAVSALRDIRKTFSAAVSALDEYKPSAVVLIDYPDFNLRLAAQAGKRGIKVVYYVSPQVWAWRKNRIWKIAGLVDKMAAILPFEPEIYSRTGLECEFVGHPVYDEIRRMNQDKGEIRKSLGLPKEGPVLSLLPGSRPHELESLLPLMVEVVGLLKSDHPGHSFCMPFAPNTDLSLYSSMIDRLKAEGVRISRGDSLEVLAASDCSVVASGTASFQAALLKVPVVIVYKVFPLTYLLGKMIVKVKHISLVNILSGREVVRELLQSDATAENAAAEIRRIIDDRSYRDEIIKACSEVEEIFRDRHASERVAEIVIETAGWTKEAA